MDGFVIRKKNNNNDVEENNDNVKVNISNENSINNENLEYDEVNANDNKNHINNENLDNDDINVSEDNENPIDEINKSPQNYNVDGVNRNIFYVTFCLVNKNRCGNEPPGLTRFQTLKNVLFVYKGHISLGSPKASEISGTAEDSASTTRAPTSEDPVISGLTKPMLENFYKYWKRSCLILAIAVVMDPRFKIKLVEFSFTKIYGDDGAGFINIVDEGIHQLFLEYVGSGSGTVKMEDGES
ncbi:zinc finger BED domain-containing protein DAYSLEEPER-like protein, partial [Tanacetum coccineum]